ncbi:spore germination protein [Paenibacillus aurantius]|uniref:Spore germination protein n=1 Tax=Paenibacillus aurantius TaxID=2918900 RepID=A0AA96REE1_9BACL|nr:spore germination protein [Paenibacillus aurantius]WNQ10406.1 spore germination protein [Paenibacillus aurantius]
MNKLFSLFQKVKKRVPGTEPNAVPPKPKPPVPLEDSIKNVFQEVTHRFGNSPDIVSRRIYLGEPPGIPVGILYVKGLTDATQLIQSLLADRIVWDGEKSYPPAKAISYLKHVVITVSEVNEIGDYDEMMHALFSGQTILLVEGINRALSVSTEGGARRGVEEPSTQSVIRGPREGFTETIDVNTAMVRRKIRDPRLWIENQRIGKVTHTRVALMYIKGLADEGVLKEVRHRLSRIDIDGILESGYIEEMIQDAPFSPFPTLFNTERPDTAAAWLLEGHVAVFVDGTPFILLAPALFNQYFHAPEDSYQRADFAALLRLLRFLCFFIALLAPSLYIAITTFHQELLPTPLLIGLAGQREGVPFPAFVEALAMEITFEILREASVRMPKTIGQSVSIVGTLVIGQAAVEAGLVSPAMVIIVSITAISNFVIPAFSMGISIRMLRLLFMGLAASFGLFGLVICMIGMILHLTSLSSFGVPYMAPFAPFMPAEQKDSLIRLPRWAMFSRPRMSTDNNLIREENTAAQPQKEDHA